jgi:hypothetical protein
MYDDEHGCLVLTLLNEAIINVNSSYIYGNGKDRLLEHKYEVTLSIVRDFKTYTYGECESLLG